MTTKSEQLALRCTAEQRKAWQQAADLERRALADWIRLTLDDAAQRKGEK